MCTIRGLDDNDDTVDAVTNDGRIDEDNDTAQNAVNQTKTDVACAVNNASLCNNVRITNYVACVIDNDDPVYIPEKVVCARHNVTCTTNDVVMNDDDFCVTNNNVVTNDDVANVKQLGPDQANSNTWDDVAKNGGHG